MIYFPHSSILESYNCLSSKDKKTQLPQAHLILKIIKLKQLINLAGVTHRTGTLAYARDPSVLMFQPFESFLILYINTISLLENEVSNLRLPSKVSEPFWLKDKKFNLACRKKLLKNSLIDYAQHSWFSSVLAKKYFETEDTIPFWPIHWTDPVLCGMG